MLKLTLKDGETLRLTHRASTVDIVVHDVPQPDGSKVRRFVGPEGSHTAYEHVFGPETVVGITRSAKDRARVLIFAPLCVEIVRLAAKNYTSKDRMSTPAGLRALAAREAGLRTLDASGGSNGGAA